MISDPDRPIQLIFTGKAHPHDMAGKDMIKQIVHFARDPVVRSRIVFLEDYDMNIAKHIVSGSDIWLNTPRRPMEASGTSGMKAAMNGVLNVSILDGWWDEGYTPECGWSIGKGEEYSDPGYQDEVESKTLYDLLEDEIIPLFYARGRDGLPREWIRRMKFAMSHVGKLFSSQRMLEEYHQRYYQKSLENFDAFSKDEFAVAKEVAAYVERITAEWPKIRIAGGGDSREIILEAGESLSVSARVALGNLSTEDLQVELYWGKMVTEGELFETKTYSMSPDAQEGDFQRYSATVRCEQTGRQGYAVRVLPRHPHIHNSFLPGLIKWAE